MPSLHISHNTSLVHLLSLRLDARAAALAVLDNVHDLPAMLDWAKTAGLPVAVLGGGSNLAPTGDLRALVIRVANRGISQVQDGPEHKLVTAAAGESWHGLVRWSIAQGLAGLENLALIPGTVGAAPVQNIGAYGAELAPLVQQVTARDLATGYSLHLDREACGFGYRDSIFKGAKAGQLLITDVTLRLPLAAGGGWQPMLAYAGVGKELAALGCNPQALSPAMIAEAVIRIRRRRLPDLRQTPNAGSFFKNPELGADLHARLLARHPDLPGFPGVEGKVKVPAAWLIEACGLKGRQHPAGAAVSRRHALVLTCQPMLPPAALYQLVAEVQQEVFLRFGINLEQEPQTLLSELN